VCSDKMFNGGSEGRCVSFIPLLLSLLHGGWPGPQRAIQSIRVGRMGPWDVPLLTTQGEQPLGPPFRIETTLSR
jgi:hypothetical protein